LQWQLEPAAAPFFGFFFPVPLQHRKSTQPRIIQKTILEITDRFGQAAGANYVCTLVLLANSRIVIHPFKNNTSASLQH
jgi:hypothetical protein